MKSRSQMEELSLLIKERNEVDDRISQITGRPANIGALGEHIASLIFCIKLIDSKSARSIDGWFQEGPLTGRSVNIKWYAKLEKTIDLCTVAPPDFYLVLSGPRSKDCKSLGPRPLLIHHVHLFDAAALDCRLSRVKKGAATSVRSELWDVCEIYPESRSPILTLSQEQREALRLFT